MPIHRCTEQGKRPYNEDRMVRYINCTGEYPGPKVNIFCIFDGHGGSKVSSYLFCKMIPSLLKYKRFPLHKDEISELFDQLQRELIQKKIANEGSTATVVIQYRKRGKHYLQTINVGDSRAICVSDTNQLCILTRDHKPSMSYEQDRIDLVNRRRRDKKEVYYDGYVHRVHDLAVSRSMGDAYAAPQVTHKPEITTFTGEVKFFVIASDGLWDAMSNEEVADFVNKNKSSTNLSKLLADEALRRGSGDNISIYTVFNKRNGWP